MKHKRTLTLYCGSSPVKCYPVSLGYMPVGHKQNEGDEKTPEGIYRISGHKRDSTCHRALRVSYPDQNDVKRAARLGRSPGSNIMVHGIGNGLGFIGRAHRFFDWTDGCVAVTNPEIEQIYEAVKDGTKIEIRE